MFPQRLKSLRKVKNRTQQNIADLLGITRQGYAKYENGQSEPDNETLQRIADYFGVTTDYLLGRTDNPDPHNKVTVAGQEITLTREELKVFEELKKHPIMFNDLASDPEKKIKELIKLYKMKKMFLEEDDEEYGVDGFGDLED